VSVTAARTACCSSSSLMPRRLGKVPTVGEDRRSCHSRADRTLVTGGAPRKARTTRNKAPVACGAATGARQGRARKSRPLLFTKRRAFRGGSRNVGEQIWPYEPTLPVAHLTQPAPEDSLGD